ncbi:MAG: family acetyltransferase [Variovorax sp.]|nr:family acetyltransferase [Variovorax sp.]
MKLTPRLADFLWSPAPFEEATPVSSAADRAGAAEMSAAPYAHQPLLGPRVELRPLARSDAEALVAAASDGALWNLPFTEVPSAGTVARYIRDALDGRAAGTALPYATVIRESGQVVGTTRFCRISARHRKLEIGGTWLATAWQRSFVNTEAKFLMLRFAFERLGCVRVQFQADAGNRASRAALLRLGAVEEGIARSERIMPDGRLRDSVQFSIVEREWPAVRERLARRLAQGGPAPD